MQNHVETTIDTPREKVFEFLVNPYQIPLILPGLIENTDIPQLPLKVGDAFTYRYQVVGVEFTGKWIVTELDEPAHYGARTEGGGDTRWRYELTDRDGGTHVSLTVDYEPPKSVVDKVSTAVFQRINQKDGESLMDNLKTILELRNA